VAGFDAFISYSRRASTTLATDLQVAVEKFGKPFYRLRSARVFRDDASMSANVALWSTIERGLTDAGWFILLASPLAAQSEFVAREVTWWREHKPTNRILIVLEEGVDIVWDQAANDFDFGATDSLPRALSGAFGEEPRWIDLRWYEASGSLGAQDPRWMERVADVAAAVRGAERDELIGENVRQHKRAQLALRSGITLISLFLVASLVATYVALGQRAEANKQRDEATKQRDAATQQARIALARQLAAQAVSLAPTDLQTASLLAVQAYRTNADAQTRAALFQIATTSPLLMSVLPMNAEVTASAATKDGVVITGDAAGDVVRWTSGQPEQLGSVGGQVYSIGVSGDGSVVAVAAPDGVTVWRGGGSTTLTELKGPLRVAVDDAGTMIAASNGPTASELWTLGSGVPVAVGRVHKGGSSDLTFVEGFLVMAGASGEWAFATVDPFELAGSGGHQLTMTTRFAVSADGLVMAGEGDTTDFPAWRGDATYGDANVANAVAHFGFAGALGVALSADGSLMAAQGSSALQVAVVQDPGDAALRPRDLGGTGNVTNANGDALTFGGNRYLVSASGHDALLWDLQQVTRIGTSFPAPVAAPCRACGPGRVAVSPDGSSALSWGLGDIDVGPTVVDLETGQVAQIDPEPSTSGNGYSPVAWVSDDELVAYRGSDDSLVTMGADGSSPAVVASVPIDSFSDPVTDIGVADGHVLLAQQSGAVMDVDLDSGVTTTRTGLTEIPDIAGAYFWRFAPDGSSLAVLTVKEDGTRVLLQLDLDSDEVVGEVPAVGAAYDADSRLHAFDGRSTFVLEAGKPGDVTPSGRVEAVPPPIVSPDGTVVVSGGQDGTVSLNDLTRQGTRFGSFSVPQQDGSYVVSAFTPGGTDLVTAVPTMSGGDSSVRILSLDPRDWIAASCKVAARDLTGDDWSRYGVGPAPDDLRCVQ
jgi:WD40 repeat protein